MISEFTTPTRIVFGQGAFTQLSRIIAPFGNRILLVTGKTLHVPDLMQQFLAEDKKVTGISITGEPTIEEVTEAVVTARTTGTDVVIGIGGGSVIDTAKAVAALVNNPGETPDYLEVIGRGKPLTSPPLPCIVVPTTSGTGAEVTKNSVLRSPEHQLKVSLRSPFLYPHTAIVDPSLTLQLPPAVTASTGLDALTQCIEAFISCKATPFTDILAGEGITRALRSLAAACNNGSDIAARSDLSFAALLSGMALANAGLGAVHGFAAVIGGVCAIPHGIVCAQLLPQVLRAIITSAAALPSDSTVLSKLRKLARLCSKEASDDPGIIIATISALYETLPLPERDSVVIDRSLFPRLIEGARNASSMKGSPVVLSDEAMKTILMNAFG